MILVAEDRRATGKVSHNYWKTFQAPESKCRSPLRPRASELHLRKPLHEIQKRNLSLYPRELGSNTKMRTRAEREMFVVQPFQI